MRSAFEIMTSKNSHSYGSSTSGTESENDHHEVNKLSSLKRKQRAPKSFTRNALMARENRLRKKLYMENLEQELAKERQRNKKYTNILKQQAEIMDKQEQEIKYMRSILANNSDISKLLSTIHNKTGLSVGTSLNKNDPIYGNTKKIIHTTTDLSTKDEIHPWSDSHISLGRLSPIEMIENQIYGDIDLPSSDVPVEILQDMLPLSSSLDDHTYTTVPQFEAGDSMGVCLHISNHKVSLEFCAQCHGNASQAWNEEPV